MRASGRSRATSATLISPLRTKYPSPRQLARDVARPGRRREPLAPVLGQRAGAPHVAPLAREHEEPQLREHHADGVVGVVHEQRAPGASRGPPSARCRHAPGRSGGRRPRRAGRARPPPRRAPPGTFARTWRTPVVHAGVGADWRERLGDRPRRALHRERSPAARGRRRRAGRWPPARRRARAARRRMIVERPRNEPISTIRPGSPTRAAAAQSRRAWPSLSHPSTPASSASVGSKPAVGLRLRRRVASAPRRSAEAPARPAGPPQHLEVDLRRAVPAEGARAPFLGGVAEALAQLGPLHQLAHVRGELLRVARQQAGLAVARSTRTGRPPRAPRWACRTGRPPSRSATSPPRRGGHVHPGPPVELGLALRRPRSRACARAARARGGAISASRSGR